MVRVVIEIYGIIESIGIFEFSLEEFGVENLLFFWVNIDVFVFKVSNFFGMI